MSDLLKSALSYIGSASTSNSGNSYPVTSEIIKLAGENVKLLKVIAEGGSSYIYGGQFVQTNDILAIKKIPCQHDNEDKILSEIKFMSSFNHANIAKYFGYNKISGVYWIGLEYCSTVPLPLPPEYVGPVFGQIVSGVEYLHKLGITHWDLKVENCMLGRDQMIKLIDFGSASTKTYITSHLTTMQRNQLEDQLFQLTTPMYRPPEILDLWSGMIIDFHVDIWALGCVLYYLVCSEHPFSDSNKLAIINCKYARKSSSYENLIEGLLVINPLDRTSLDNVLQQLEYLRIDYTSPIPIPFEDFHIGPSIIPVTSSASLLHSIRGGAENLLKNLKESGSRIYSTQPQQHQAQHPPTLPKEHAAPKRPPPPKITPETPRKQLTGEDTANVAKLESSSLDYNQVQAEATTFDLLSGFESQVKSDPANSSPRLKPMDSVDLLGGFKDDIGFVGGPSQNNSQRSGSITKKTDNLLGDLFDLNQSRSQTTTQTKPDIKKDLFDSLFSEQPSTTEKPLLPTSSSFHHLGSLKVENKNDLVKSTPNLNDLFGDLLLDQSGVSGQKSSSSYGSSIAFGTSVKPSFGVGPTCSNTQFTTGKAQAVNSNANNSISNSTIGGRNDFPPFTSNTTPLNVSSDRTSYQSHDNTAKGVPVTGTSTFNDTKSQPFPGINKKLDLNAAFGELLNEQGFCGSSTTTNVTRTINEMRRTELMQTKTPEQLKVNDWVEGKRKNIRALLSTLHTVVWESCSWKATSMSTMVEANDVKKVYRKACLAIHPDKQCGHQWEELAKLIFIELNEAWSHFENDNF